MHLLFDLAKARYKEDVRRAFKWFWQRRTRGFDDRELWSLDHTIARFVLPRLRAFKEHTPSHPLDVTEEEWNRALDRMIESLEFYSTTLGDVFVNYEQLSRHDEGLRLFAKYFGDLWS